MDLLKKILRQAITTQAPRVRVVVGSAPEVIDGNGQNSAVAGVGAVSREELAQLFEFLFPNDKTAITNKQLVRGALNVPNVGKIYLIAQPAEPASLRMYLPPTGEALCESEWGRLTNRTVAPDPSGPTTEVIRPAPIKPAPTTAEAPPSAAALFSGAEPEAPQTAARRTTIQEPTPASGGFIPLGLGTTAPLATTTIAQPAGIEASAVRNPPRPSGAADTNHAAFAPQIAPTMPPASLAVAPTLAAPSIPMMAPQIPMMTPPAAFPDPFTAPSPRPDEPETLDFGPDAGGLASRSQGQNPIDSILSDMVKRRASDLHMTCGEPYCFRIDGDITRIGQDPVDAMQMEQYLTPIMPDRNRKEFIKQNDTDFAYEIEGVGRFRVNIFRDRNGVGTVMRHIPSKILTAEQLNLPPAITKFCELTKGLVLVTGPTGSGKSTTLAAMIDLINKNRSDHILTVEDPIEFVHPQQRCLVNQREVHKHTNSFARALKAALREDPDIVLIGEMRDLETIAIAIETAETGHLVFGTLHTTTAVSTVDRIVDQFPSDRQEQIRMMLASSLRGVVAQTLLKKKGGGRVAAHEILVTNDAVSAMIREGKNHMIGNHMQSQKTDGNQLLNEALSKLVKDGLIDAEEAYRKAVDKAALAEIFRRMNVNVSGMTPPAASGRPPPASGNRSA